MTRHSKNATNGATYTYNEKNKDSKQSGYGSKNVRLSKDSIKDFDCCSLSLQPCRNPVITPNGWIYEKEAILECILSQKVANSKLLKKFAAQKNEKNKELNELAEIAHKEKIEKFIKTEGKLVPSSASSSISKKETDAEIAKSVCNMNSNYKSKLPSFWIPSLVPESKTIAPMKKPDTTIYCPMNKTPLSMKDLFEVKFKLLEDKNDNRALIIKQDRYVCAVSNDVLGNNVACCVLKTSGAVVTQECVDKIIKKDMIDPISSKKLVDSDIIPIQRGGTGYAGSSAKLTSSKYSPAIVS